MSNVRKQDEGWQACQPGTLAKLACLDRRLQRRQFLKRAGSAGGLIGMGMMGAWILTQGGNESLENAPPLKVMVPGDKMYGGILCSKVKEQGQLFLDGTLSNSVVEQIEIHLQNCFSCKDFIDCLSEPDITADV